MLDWSRYCRLLWVYRAYIQAFVSDIILIPTLPDQSLSWPTYRAIHHDWCSKYEISLQRKQLMDTSLDSKQQFTSRALTMRLTTGCWLTRSFLLVKSLMSPYPSQRPRLRMTPIEDLAMWSSKHQQTPKKLLRIWTKVSFLEESSKLHHLSLKRAAMVA